MEAAVTGLDANLISLNTELEKTIELMRNTTDIAEKSKLADIINALSNAQKNFAETISILQDQALELFGNDYDNDDDDFEDFDEDEFNSFMNSKQVEFKSNKKKKGKGKKKAHDDKVDDDEDLPF